MSILPRLQLLCQRRRKHRTLLFAQTRRVGFQQHTCEFCTDTEVWYRDLSETCNGCLLSFEHWEENLLFGCWLAHILTLRLSYTHWITRKDRKYILSLLNWKPRVLQSFQRKRRVFQPLWTATCVSVCSRRSSFLCCSNHLRFPAADHLTTAIPSCSIWAWLTNMWFSDDFHTSKVPRKTEW